MTRSIAIIPARGGSRRIPRKNIKLFHGKPIIAYSIETAFDSGLFDAVFVSTDDAGIAAVASEYGARVVRRPAFAAKDSVGTQRVMQVTMDTFGVDTAQYACCIYATAPMMTVADLCFGYAWLRAFWHPFVRSVNSDGTDVGQWYWGTSVAFRDDVPLDAGLTYTVPSDRVCDINTPEDWARAEEMYACLMKG
jgi:N-acylneuraminate cytidylyltransferase